MTNKEKYFPGCTLNEIELAKNIRCPQKITGEEILCPGIGCTSCLTQWLKMECDAPKIEQQKPKVPSQIDRQNFERQLESFSIKAFVQQFKYLACKINEVLEYLEETK